MPATLDGFLRSTTPAKRGAKRADGADSGSTKKKAKKAGSPSDGAGGTPKTSGKGKAKAASPASGKGKKGKAVKGKKRKKTFVEDNRNLGTVDLLDSTDEDEVEVLAESPSAAKSGSNGVKRIVLEEEEWLADEADQPKKQDFATDAPVEQDDGPEGTANLLSAPSKLRDPAEQDPFDGCTDDEGELTVLGPSKKGKERAVAAEDDDLVVEGGLTCPGCKASLDSMPEEDRDSHVNSCLDSSAAQTSSSSAPSRGLLAPLSRLFTFSSSSAPSASSSIPAPAPQPGPSKPMSFLPNAFTALMRGHDEANQWKKAEEADKQKGRLPKGEERKVPFYKWIDGMEITVDAFKYGKIDGCKAYFLSHAHSDHYQNLNSSWSHGEIYASQTTINLIKLKLKVKDEYLFPLPMDKTVKVHGIDVTLIDANHCPGSVLFLFEGPHTDPKSPFSKTPNRIFRYLHCGDFRASPQHILHPSMSYPTPATSRMMARASSSTSQPSSSQPPDPLPGRTLKRLDAIYLDTTYLSPSYCFPAQELVISACAELVRERIVGGDETALWRADGREAERKGMKGWLKGDGTGVKKEEEGVKEEEEMERMMQLGEGEERESQTPMPGLADDEQLYGDIDEPMELERLPEETDDAVMEGGGDEEAWLAVHADETQDAEAQEGEMQEGEMQEGETQVGATEAGDDSQGWPLANVDDPACCDDGDDLGEFSAPQVQHSAGESTDVKAEGEVQEEQSEERPAIDGAADIKAEEADEKPDVKPKKERLLVLVGTYSIGKERIVKAIAQALSTKVFCDSYKRSLFLAQDDPDLHALLTEDPLEAQVHIGGLRDITREAMQEYLAKFKAPRIEGGFTKMIGLRPTGWTYRSETKDKYPSIPKILQIEQQRKFSPAGLYPQRDSTPMTMAFGVPYSEHSSFFELTCFCLSLDWTRVIPTVNVHTASSRNKMKGWIDRWGAEKKRRADAKLPKIVPFRNVNYW